MTYCYKNRNWIFFLQVCTVHRVTTSQTGLELLGEHHLLLLSIWKLELQPLIIGWKGEQLCLCLSTFETSSLRISPCQCFLLKLPRIFFALEFYVFRFAKIIFTAQLKRLSCSCRIEFFKYVYYEAFTYFTFTSQFVVFQKHQNEKHFCKFLCLRSREHSWGKRKSY